MLRFADQPHDLERAAARYGISLDDLATITGVSTCDLLAFASGTKALNAQSRYRIILTLLLKSVDADADGELVDIDYDIDTLIAKLRRESELLLPLGHLLNECLDELKSQTRIQ